MSVYVCFDGGLSRGGVARAALRAAQIHRPRPSLERRLPNSRTNGLSDDGNIPRVAGPTGRQLARIFAHLLASGELHDGREMVVARQAELAKHCPHPLRLEPRL
eukprot:1195056-Prorocentrum_minimum.AAC.3